MIPSPLQFNHDDDARRSGFGRPRRSTGPSAESGIDRGIGFTSRKSGLGVMIVISLVQVVVVDLHWSAPGVHVQDADASVLFWLP